MRRRCRFQHSLARDGSRLDLHPTFCRPLPHRPRLQLDPVIGHLHDSRTYHIDHEDDADAPYSM